MIPFHGIASREDLPLPLPLVAAGGALTLLITFIILIFAWRQPRYDEQDPHELPRLGRLVDSRFFGAGVKATVLLLWGLSAIGLWFGPDLIANPIFGFVFVVLWVGLVPASLLGGRIYRRTNPLRTLWAWGKPSDADTQLSRVPAAIAVVVFIYFELIEPRALTLPAMRIAVVAFLAWVIGWQIFARSGIERADPFEAFASAVARMSPWTRSSRGVLAVTHPLRNLASWNPPSGTAWLAMVLLGGTLFDAVSASSWWVRTIQALGINPQLAGVIGLVSTIALLTATYVLCVMPLRSRSGASTRVIANALAPSLIPLLVCYGIAHYGTYLYLEGQRTLIRLADPAARGWNLFQAAELGPDTTLFLFPTGIAVAQVVVIVIGHIVAALVAHDISLRTTKRILNQVPLLTMMVALTIGGLLLMFG